MTAIAASIPEAVVPVGAGDRITVLKCVTGLASKRVLARPDAAPEIQGYSAGALFHVLELPVTNIPHLSLVLQAVEKVRSALVIRGAPRPDLDLQHPHRRRKTNFQTPPAGRRWILIDFDEIPLPAGMGLHEDISAVCEHLITLLPPEFYEATCYWQLSSRAGLGNPAVVSMHLWFWLDRPIPDSELKRWGRWWNEKSGTKIIDTTLFNDVQAHYTAAPEFVGMADPFPVRSGLLRRRGSEVALRLPAPRPVCVCGGIERGGGIQPSGAFEAILSEIGDHPGGQGFHLPIIRAVASYVATRESATVDVEALYETVRLHVIAADRSRHPDSHIEDMASREHIIPAITTAIAKYGNADSPRRKSRQIEGIAPHFNGNPASVAKAARQLQQAIDDFFR